MTATPTPIERRAAAQREIAAVDHGTAVAALEILERPAFAQAIEELRALHDPAAADNGGDSVNQQIGYLIQVGTNVPAALVRKRDALGAFLNPEAPPSDESTGAGGEE